MRLQFHETSSFDEQNRTALRILLIVEACLVFMAFLPYCLVAFYFRKTRLHMNLKRIVAYGLAGYVFDMITRFIILLYEFGLFGEDITKNIQFSKVNLTLDVFQNSSIVIIFICSFYRVYYMGVIGSISLFGAVERYLATSWVVTYEKKQRRWLFVLLLIWYTMGCMIFSTIIHFDIILSMLHLVVIVYIMSVCSVLTGNYIYLRNKKLRKSVENRSYNKKYSLSYRFQINENVKVMKFFRFLVMVLATFNFCLVIFLYLSNDPNIDPLFSCYAHAAFNIGIGIYALVTLSVLTVVDRNIRRVLLSIRLIRAIASPFFRRCFPDEFGKRKSGMSQSEETNVYFTSLTSQWNIPIDRKEAKRKWSLKKKNNSVNCQ